MPNVDATNFNWLCAAQAKVPACTIAYAGQCCVHLTGHGSLGESNDGCKVLYAHPALGK